MNQEIIEGRDCEVQKPSSLAPFPTTMLNVTVTQVGLDFEVWVRWGRKNWQVGTGPLDQMLAKRDRLLKFISDPFAPCAKSVGDFVLMAKNV